MFDLRAFSVGPYDNNVYILSDPRTREALLIDAANDAPRISRELKDLALSHILTTHGHPDHVQAVEAIRHDTSARFTCHAADGPLMPIPPDVEARDGDGNTRWGVGVHESVLTASLRAVVSAFTRLHPHASERPAAPRVDTQPVV